ERKKPVDRPKSADRQKPEKKGASEPAEPPKFTSRRATPKSGDGKGKRQSRRMEWVEVTGRTVEEAKDLALDRLGVDERDAEFEVIEEPRAGFFGRLKGEARVRARVKPTLRAK